MCGVTNSTWHHIAYSDDFFYPFDDKSTLSTQLQTAYQDNISTIFDSHITTIYHKIIIFAFKTTWVWHKLNSNL